MEGYWIHCGTACDAPFTGDVKDSCEDFRVSELGMDGRVVRVSDDATDPPHPPFVTTFLQWQADPAAFAAASEAPSAASAKPPRLEEFVSAEKAAEIATFAEPVAAEADAAAAAEATVDVGEMPEKADRRRFVDALRTRHPPLTMARSEGGSVRVSRCTFFPVMEAVFGREAALKIVLFTLGTEKRMQCPYVSNAAKEDKRRFNERLGSAFGMVAVSARDGVVTFTRKAPKRKRAEVDQPYTHFHLEKRDFSWFDAVRLIARGLGCRAGDVQCAGLKDKKAVTAQRCAVKGVHGEALAEADQSGLCISDVSYETTGLRTGDLTGNHFEVVVRRVEPADAPVEAACRKVGEDGFPNFFGSQRFSHTARQDQHVGLCLARGEWAAAVDVLMAATDEDGEDAAAAKARYAAGDDAREVARSLPPFRDDERAVLLEKARWPAEPARWVRAAAYSAREMWMHSLQSWLWNKALHRRIEKHGRAVLKGDLLLPPLEAGKKAEKQTPVVCEDPSKHSAFEVVLPKVGGPSGLFPENEAGALYDEVLREYGLPRQGWVLKDVGVRLSESYRHVFVRPTDLTCSVDTEDGSAALEFSLPSSCYATVFLGTVMGKVL